MDHVHRSHADMARTHLRLCSDDEQRALAIAVLKSLADIPASPPTVGAGIIATLRKTSRAGWRFLKRLNARLEASTLGDAIGCVCLMGAFWGGVLIVGVLQ